MVELEKTFEMSTVPCKFGVGATEEIGAVIKKIRAKRVLVLCGQTISKNTDIPIRVKGSIEAENVDVEIWDKVEPEPAMSYMEKAFDFVKSKEFDCFVGVGGGSTIAASKIIDLYASYPADFYDFLPRPFGKGKRVPGKIRPLILLPTTAGTGSEASEVVVMDFHDESGNRKRIGVRSEYFLPDLAILDPLNTVTMPPQLTAYTGLDALLIAIGVYTARPYHTMPKIPVSEQESIYMGSNPFTDILSEKSIELCGKYLRRSYANGYDLEARGGMLFASYLAGIAVGKAGVHISHAMAFAMGEKVHADAGMRVSLISPACLDFIAPVIPGRMSRIAQLLSTETEIDQGKIEASASEILKRLLKDLKFPNGISELGFEEKDIPKLSDRALKEHRLIAQSPRFITKEDLEEIFKASLRLW